MRNLKMMAIAVLIGVMSFINYGASIGGSNDMSISGSRILSTNSESRITGGSGIALTTTNGTILKEL